MQTFIKMESSFSKVVFFILFQLAGFVCFSQAVWKRDYLKVDAHACSIPPTVDLVSLARELTDIYVHPADKYRAIYAWIALHIGYDESVLSNPKSQELHPIKIILSQKTGCAGFASLFSTLCQAAGLECEIVKGWCPEEHRVGKGLAPLYNHEWNAIKINSEWYLCDVTWGAGQLVDGQFIFDFNGYYFCTPAPLFALEHFPIQKKWLLGVEMNKKQYANIPYFYTPAIAANIQDCLPQTGIVIAEKGKTQHFSFSVEVPVKNISIKTPSNPTPLVVPFVQTGNKVSFRYEWDSFAPFIQILVNHKTYLKYYCVAKLNPKM